MNKKRFRILVVLCCLLCAPVAFYFARVEWQIWSWRSASPADDVTRAIAAHQTQFIGVYGYSLSTPGVPDALINSLVELHGIKPIEGTTDAIFLPRQMAFQEAASNYASKYNVLLARRLIASPDAATSRLIGEAQAELTRLERADPVADALSSFRSKSPKFIGIAGESFLGLPDNWDANPIVYNNPYIWLKSNDAILNAQNRKRLRQIIQSYVIPYNKKLFALLTKPR